MTSPSLFDDLPPSPLIEVVHDALCLAASPRSRGWLLQVARWLLEARGHAPERPPSLAAITDAMDELVQQGRAQRVEGLGVALPLDAAWQARFTTLMRHPAAPNYWRAFAAANGGGMPLRPDGEPAWVRLPTAADRVGLLRLVLYSPRPAADLVRLLDGPLVETSSAATLTAALTAPFVRPLFGGLPPEQRGLLAQIVMAAHPDTPAALREAVDDWLRCTPDEVPPPVRCRLAAHRLHAGDVPGMHQALLGLAGPLVELFDALALAHAGQWPQAAADGQAAMKAAAKGAGKRQAALPPELVWPLVLSLLAQPEATAWSAARKLCVAQSGSRSPAPHSFWGLWAHAAAVRLGDQSIDPQAFSFASSQALEPDQLLMQASRMLLAAWVGHTPGGWTALRARHLIDGLADLGQHWMAALAREAAVRLGLMAAADGSAGTPAAVPGGTPPAPFLAAPREAWRDALAAIAALGGDGTPDHPLQAAVPTLLWCLTLDEEGRVQAVQPYEQPPGARKPKPLTLNKVKASARLDARDAAVARNIERSRWSARQLVLDVTGAAQSLVRHPGVFFHDAPGQLVELSEALPIIEVARRLNEAGEQFVFRIDPPLQPATPPHLGEGWFYAEERQAEVERRNSLRVVRDAPDRARLIRITAAQRRVAELVSQDWAVPVGATAELEAALKVLAGHFQLHSDAAAGTEVPGESRLRAQLVPVGDALQLRLVVMPFGAFGPAVPPAVGRERLMTVHEGLSLATRRDLAQEAAHLHGVLDALPWLEGSEAGEAGWLLDTPELALQTVEALPTLPAIAALDWPRGKPVRVTTVAPHALAVRVSSERQWFALEGELKVDDHRVVGLQQLLQMAQQAKTGRFVALGEGEYLALTERLRQQLADLSALGAQRPDGVFALPAAGAAWLEATLDGMQVDGDNPWRQRLAALQAAAQLQPELPKGLRAELRSYQAEGYAWMSRLAHAGLGACLADDMGLGKTVQTLAMLLARAERGPALVVAPTSVAGNWLAEAQTFAPGLRAAIYGDAGNERNRDASIDEAGPGDLLIVSYALVQLDAERFARRTWATLVMDEAQAVKNAATKRAKSVAELKADFRLALTGTPVENRLADLWSIMNMLNPGLLGTATQFNERFGSPIEKQQDATARARLRRLVSPFLLRRTKAQVLTDLPPRTEIVHQVQPSEAERNFLEALRRNAVERIQEMGEKGGPDTAFHVLAELTRLRRAACDPRLVSPELGIVGSKAQEFETLVRELVDGQHKALVFSQFTDFLKLLGRRLDDAGIAYQYLDGSTPGPERARRVAAFQRGEGELFLISLKAGGFGLNLTMADYVLIVDPWWNPAAEDQAMGRAHRIGQQRPVTVYRLVTAGSIEERIVDLHRDKRGLADGLLEGQDEGKAIGADELRELLLGTPPGL